MGKINVLDSSVFNKISAGEVVERPASVVKELVENSIDAGASFVQIFIENGGINKIRVVDNGSGIAKDDIKNAFLPHATSKLKVADDLFNIQTLGFRGEALASIASVSKVDIISKTTEQDAGVELNIEAGKLTKETEIGAPTGTNIIVEDLFFNVPVRYKFLKKPKQEEQEITNLLSRIILANPKVAIKYTADGKEIFNSRGTSLADAILIVYGRETSANILEVNSSFTGLEISGYIGKPSYSKANRTYQTIIINGRHIENNLISLAVSNAYGETLMKRQYPFFVLNINLPFGEVDVNVHPSKKEVKFENSNKIFGAVYTAVANALQINRDVKNIETEEKSFEINNRFEQTRKFDAIIHKNLACGTSASDVFDVKDLNKTAEEFENESLNRPIADAQDVIKEQLKENILNFKQFDESRRTIVIEDSPEEMPAAQTSFVEPEITQEKMDNNLFEQEKCKVIGTFLNTYILVEQGTDLILVDQHAGHEKLLFDKLMNEVESKQLESQNLLLPEFVYVNSLEKNYVDDKIDDLNELGFDITPFGEDCYKISAVPFLLSNIKINEFWKDLLVDLQDYSKKSLGGILKDRIASCACKHAVKGEDVLSEKEIQLLLQGLSNEKVALHCPHGRPIVVRVTKTEIEKWFKRIV